MKILLDTNALIFWHDNSPRLSTETKQIISNADHVFVSIASVWEMAIKVAKGHLETKEETETILKDNMFLPLTINFAHIRRMQKLPPIHSDPFDRMIVAQALEENLILVTCDRHMKRYDVPIFGVA